jgi:ISXO2-like transposase domain/Transposase DNA-binding
MKVLEAQETVWVRDELGSASLPDRRHRKRGIVMLKRMAQRPAGRVLDVFSSSAERQGAGFAKVAAAPETRAEVQAFVDKAIAAGIMVNTDGGQALRDLERVDSDFQITNQDPEIISRWLPWVHRFISNAKAWILGTHHGIEAKYLDRYRAEYTYRLNRRTTQTPCFTGHSSLAPSRSPLHYARFLDRHAKGGGACLFAMRAEFFGRRVILMGVAPGLCGQTLEGSTPRNVTAGWEFEHVLSRACLLRFVERRSVFRGLAELDRERFEEFLC